MNTSRLFSTACFLLVCFTNLPSQTVNFTVIVPGSPSPISPYIYGANPKFTANENLTARRLGGNRLTGYNWENNASHAGTDWNNYNDDLLAADLSNPDAHGGRLTAFHDEALGVGAYPLITLQMAGYAAKDKNGTSVTEAETAPSARFVKVHFTKGSSFSLSPDLTDSSVFMDECVHFLVQTFGTAESANAIKGYELDNEPALWPTTHPRIHPLATTCNEIVQNGIALSSAVKNVDSSAEIFGPVLYGFSAYYNFQGAADWDSVSKGKNYNWFIDYYLDEMKKAETTYGKRLLNVLDLHWYPEAIGDNRITDTGANSATDKAARLQAPRTLWDSNYIENSWIGKWFSAYLPLLPQLQASIATYYPGTKLAFSEFTYGGEHDMSGALSTADVLGIFGKYGVYFATFWPGNSTTSYVQAAYRIYRNYDGSNSTFGNASIPAHTSDSVSCSIYGSVNTGTGDVHLVVLNKNLTGSKTGIFSLSGVASITGGTVWVLDSSSTQIKQADALTSITGNSFSYTLPAGSVSHIVLKTTGTSVERPLSGARPASPWLEAYPNPFNPSCKIDYRFPDHTPHTLMIIDFIGRTVRTYRILSQIGSTQWDGKNEQGHIVASGIYYVVVRGGSSSLPVKKIIFLK